MQHVGATVLRRASGRKLGAPGKLFRHSGWDRTWKIGPFVLKPNLHGPYFFFSTLGQAREWICVGLFSAWLSTGYGEGGLLMTHVRRTCSETETLFPAMSAGSDLLQFWLWLDCTPTTLSINECGVVLGRVVEIETTRVSRSVPARNMRSTHAGRWVQLIFCGGAWG
jgi:hypothetical protein